MMRRVFTVNAGSSSLKFSVFAMPEERRLLAGNYERLGGPEAALRFTRDGEEVRSPGPVADVREALARILEQTGVAAEDISAVGHRVVHGGEAFSDAVVIGPDVERAIEAHARLAPLHNPANLAGIRAATALFPGTPQVAVFDTAFHQSIPQEAFLYALPYRLYEEQGVRRYGFHGTSHRYVAARAAELLGRPLEELALITLHLGNGCSATAIRGGRSVDTSMGLTPLPGLVMGTRPGDVDPGTLLYIKRVEGLDDEALETMLNRQSGLLGLSGHSHDLRDLEEKAAAGDARARLALAVFAHRARRYIGAFHAVLDGADAIVLTGGIGEHGVAMRERVLADLTGLGIALDRDRNRAAPEEGDIATDDSPVRLLVVPTDEERMIARDTAALLAS